MNEARAPLLNTEHEPVPLAWPDMPPVSRSLLLADGSPLRGLAVLGSPIAG
jgi:hypothetical protein